jgi:hypothetical protein
MDILKMLLERKGSKYKVTKSGQTPEEVRLRGLCRSQAEQCFEAGASALLLFRWLDNVIGSRWQTTCGSWCSGIQLRE